MAVLTLDIMGKALDVLEDLTARTGKEPQQIIGEALALARWYYDVTNARDGLAQICNGKVTALVPFRRVDGTS